MTEARTLVCAHADALRENLVAINEAGVDYKTVGIDALASGLTEEGAD